MILVTGSEHTEIRKAREISKGVLTPHDLRSGLATGAALATGATVVAGGTAAALARHQRGKQRKVIRKEVSKAGTTAPIAPAASAAPSQIASAPPKLKKVPPAGAANPPVVLPGASTIKKADDRSGKVQRRAAFEGGVFGGVAGATGLDYKHARDGLKPGGKHARFPNGTKPRNAAIIGGAALIGAAATQRPRLREARRSHAARVLSKTP